MKEPTGDEEETIRQYETAQARHDPDYSPMSSTKRAAEFEQRKLCATRYFGCALPHCVAQESRCTLSLDPRRCPRLEILARCLQVIMGLKVQPELGAVAEKKA